MQYALKDYPFTFTLAGTNLFNKTYATYGQRFGGGFWDAGGPPTVLSAPPRSALSVVRGRPREVSLTFRYDF